MGKKLKSPVWEYFSQTDDSGVVVCLKSNKMLQYSNHSTGSMRKHLSGIHSIYLGDASNKKKEEQSGK